MKYIVRILAALPMLSVGIAAVLSFVFAFEYKILIILCIGNMLAFIILANNYENTVKSLKNFVQKMAKETLVYE